MRVTALSLHKDKALQLYYNKSVQYDPFRVVSVGCRTFTVIIVISSGAIFTLTILFSCRHTQAIGSRDSVLYSWERQDDRELSIINVQPHDRACSGQGYYKENWVTNTSNSNKNQGSSEIFATLPRLLELTHTIQTKQKPISRFGI